MINIIDNRKEYMAELDDVECGRFFMKDGVLYRVCWYDFATFDRIVYETDTRVCMRVSDGELVLLPYDTMVEPISDRQIEIIVGE